ncbi:methyltransferase family protein [Paracoccus endophyticus]|uniref:methyltransferase family protein n=1 Tax=Paracoccus endophyticus TaxID=2233774 RepID=UPI000DD91676|nr:isoprenylcysteine carboxylmethyltransferase family protein [Paracoccus endophyticus]
MASGGMMRRIADYPMAWVALFAALAGLAGRVAPMPVPWGGQVGSLLIGVGLGLIVMAGRTMRRAGATVDPTRPPTTLVTHGIFAWSRNPIYLGAAVVLAGIALVAAAPLALGLVALFVAIANRRFIGREEAWLAERYPTAFSAWSRHTRRWL